MLSDTDATGKFDVIKRFEMTCNIFTGLNKQVHLEGMMAILHSYRDFITRNLRTAGPIDGPTFVRWMESAERNPDDFPEPWAAELIEMFDQILIDVVEDENVSPAVAVDALDEWVEQSTAEVKAVHDLPEGFFDVE